MQRLVPGFVAQLNHPLGDVCGIVFCVCVLAFYLSALSSIIDVPLLVINVALLIIDVLLAYAGGVATWKIGVTVWEFRKLWRRGELKIRPFHPDGCGGLAAIGQLFFSLSFVLIVIGLFLGGWLVYSQSIKAGLPASDGPLGDFGPLFVGSSIAMVVASLLVFFWPLHAVHRLMKAEAAPHEAQVLALAGRIAALEKSVLCSAFRPNHEELEARLAELERLRSIYSHERKIPTWPVDLATLGKFVSAQAALWVGPTSVLGLWEKIKPLWPS